MAFHLDIEHVLTSIFVVLLAVQWYLIALQGSEVYRGVYGGFAFGTKTPKFVPPKATPFDFMSQFVRHDCLLSSKGGKKAETNVDCGQGQGPTCTRKQPCSPCNIKHLNRWNPLERDPVRYGCVACPDPPGQAIECHFSQVDGPYCYLTKATEFNGVSTKVNYIGPCEECCGFSVSHNPEFAKGTSDDKYILDTQIPDAEKPVFTPAAEMEADTVDLVPVNILLGAEVQVVQEQRFDVYYAVRGPDCAMDPYPPVTNTHGHEVPKFCLDLDPKALNGQWLSEGKGVEFGELGSYLLLAVAVNPDGKVSKLTWQMYTVIRCARDWTLSCSSLYPSGGLSNTQPALLDDFPLTTGVGTNNGEREWLEATWATPVVFRGVAVSVYSRDRWDAQHIAGKQLQFEPDYTSDGAASDSEDETSWRTAFNVTIYNATGLNWFRLPGNGVIITRKWRLWGAGFLAAGTLTFDFAGCVGENGTAGLVPINPIPDRS